jgi:hypothetical protein
MNNVYYCKDCGEDALTNDNYFMVTKTLWEKYGVGRDLLCLSCFEKRLGREVGEDDITICIVNEMHPRLGPILKNKPAYKKLFETITNN